jgi:hypothetical protein
MSQSDEDIGYDSDNEISDLQDEMRRMNLSQPDLRSRTSNGKSRKREGISFCIYIHVYLILHYS